MKKQKKSSRILGGVALGVFALAVMLAIAGLTWTMAGIRETAISKTPTAILASAGVSEDKAVSLPVVYYDQVADECVNLYDLGAQEALYQRQFGWRQCEYYNKELEQGLVEFDLGKDYLPVAVGGRLTPNRGVVGDNFKRWFVTTEGKSVEYAGVIKMNYKSEGAEFSFYKNEFYPLDVVENAASETKVGVDGHNHLFTMSFAVPFTVLGSGSESFTIAADDDTFVYVGNQLVIDMGGIHEATSGQFVIHENGEVYSSVMGQDLAYSGVTVNAGEGQLVRIFHADRDESESTFNVKFAGMNLSVMNTQLADKGEDGVQIAYDPTDSSYAVPLGETSVMQPDNSKGLIIMATIEGALIIVFSIFVVISVRAVIKRRVEK